MKGFVMKRAIILFLCLLILPSVAGAVTTTYPDETILENIKEIRFDTEYANSCEEGIMYWNEDDGTANLGITGNVCGQLLQEQLTKVRNNSGATITDGSVVLITGNHGNIPTIGLANATTEAASSKTFGMATEDIPNNSNGYVTTFGMVRNQNTSAFAIDDTVWLSTTPGQIQNTPAITPNHATFVGWIATVHATEGKILISIQNGFEYYELHDVLITSIQANDTSIYNGAYWENVPPTYGQVIYHSAGGATLDIGTTTALVNVTGLTEDIFNNVILNGTDGSIEIVDTGPYSCHFGMSHKSATPADFDHHLGVNGVDEDACHSNRTIATGTQAGGVPIPCYMELSSGDIVTGMVNSINSETIEYESINIGCDRIK